MLRSVAVSGLLALLVAGVAPAPAHANGQTTHVWISLAALDLLEPGPLKDLLTREELRDPLVNGTMFPDGGYAVSHEYGEAAHWEPFQQAYLAWIRDSFEPPYDQGAPAGHVAFLMGLGAHGMADEVFDSLFMERSRVYDPGWNDPAAASLDTASDVLFARAVDGVEPAEPWLPADVLASVFAGIGLDVEPGTLEDGQLLLAVAISAVDTLRESEERITTFREAYPWTDRHLLDERMPGSPPREAFVVARYWEDLWARLHGEPWTDAVLDSTPRDGTFNHVPTASAVESRLQISFSRGVEEQTLDRVHVQGPDGERVAVAVDHHYGNMSHSVVVRPEADWQPSTTYTLFVDRGLLNYDGEIFDDTWSMSFETGVPGLDAAPVQSTSRCSGTAQLVGPGAGGSGGAAALALLLFAAGGLSRRSRSKG